MDEELCFVIMDDEINHNINMKKRLDLIFVKNNIGAVVKLVAIEPSQVFEYAIENVDRNNVYLLDVDYGCDKNGIELALEIRQYDSKAYIIFVSAHPEFVMPSLKTKVFDFLVKPISLETLEKCILSIHKDFNSLKFADKQTLLLKSGFNVHQIVTDEIIYLEKYGHTLVVHTLNGQISSYESLENIEGRLDEKKFFRCHKSYIANLSWIAEINNKTNLIMFKNGEYCLFSKRCKKELSNICSSL